MRAAEARAFAANQLANMNYTLGTGLIPGAAERLFWRGVRMLARLLPARPEAHPSAPAPIYQGAAAA